MRINGQLWLTANWDKSHRCPVWSGPKFAGAYDEDGCPEGGTVRIDGDIEVYPYDRPWRAGTCMACGCRVFPLALNWLHPTWVSFIVDRRLRSWLEGQRWRWQRRWWQMLDRIDDWRSGPTADEPGQGTP